MRWCQKGWKMYQKTSTCTITSICEKLEQAQVKVKIAIIRISLSTSTRINISKSI